MRTIFTFVALGLLAIQGVVTAPVADLGQGNVNVAREVKEPTRRPTMDTRDLRERNFLAPRARKGGPSPKKTASSGGAGQKSTGSGAGQEPTIAELLAKFPAPPTHIPPPNPAQPPPQPPAEDPAAKKT